MRSPQQQRPREVETVEQEGKREKRSLERTTDHYLELLRAEKLLAVLRAEKRIE